jgi:hypothetical protein
MLGQHPTSKNSFISLLLSKGVRLEITPLPFFPKKFFKSKIQSGQQAAVGWNRGGVGTDGNGSGGPLIKRF